MHGNEVEDLDALKEGMGKSGYHNCDSIGPQPKGFKAWCKYEASDSTYHRPPTPCAFKFV